MAAVLEHITPVCDARRRWIVLLDQENACSVLSKPNKGILGRLIYFSRGVSVPGGGPVPDRVYIA